jgi:hypothetical protein
MERIGPLLDVDRGEDLGLLLALKCASDIYLVNTDFVMDSKTVVDSNYSYKCMLASDLVNSDMTFSRGQVVALKTHLECSNCVFSATSSWRLSRG